MSNEKTLSLTFRKASFSGDGGCVEVAVNTDREIHWYVIQNNPLARF